MLINLIVLLKENKRKRKKKRGPGGQPGQRRAAQPKGQARPSQGQPGPPPHIRRGAVRVWGTLTAHPPQPAAAGLAPPPPAPAAVVQPSAPRQLPPPRLVLLPSHGRSRPKPFSLAMGAGRQREHRPSPASFGRGGRRCEPEAAEPPPPTDPTAGAQERPVASPFTEEETKPAPRASAGGRALR